MSGIHDRAWFGIRDAARRQDWAEVEERAVALGWLLVAKQAQRAAANLEAMCWIGRALQLDRPDAPDPFAEQGDRRGA
jgi:hypothetical protein